MDDALKRAGRSAAQPVDMPRFREFVEVVRFFRIEAESRLRARRGRTAPTSQTPARPRPQAGFIARSWTGRHAGTGRRLARARRLPMSASSSIPGSRNASRHGPSAGHEPRSAPTRAVTHSSMRSGRTSSGWRRSRTADRSTTPSSEQAPASRGRRACASPRVRRRRTVLPPGSPVGGGSGQVAIREVHGHSICSDHREWIAPLAPHAAHSSPLRGRGCE